MTPPWTILLKRLPARALAAFFIVPATLGAALPAAAQAPAPTGDLEQAISALRAISTLRANFTQIDANGGQVSGVLSLKRPGKIRFQYQRGYPVLIVGDGRALTIIDSEVNQIQRWPVGDSPLGALLNPARDVTRFGRLLPSADRSLVAVEVRDKGHPEYGVITLYFTRQASAPGGLQLDGWVALDSQNRRTTTRLSGQQYGMALGEDLFRFIDPRARPHK